MLLEQQTSDMCDKTRIYKNGTKLKFTRVGNNGRNNFGNGN